MGVKIFKSFLVTAVLCFAANTAFAEPVTYVIDSGHTFPAFETDHNGGVSVWRGKINSTTGTIVLDKEAGTGEVNVEMDMGSIDFGNERMNFAATDHIIFAADFPAATYTGQLTDFVEGAPTKVEGTLTLVGVSRDLDLIINSFKCVLHPRHGREVCGADAYTSFDRSDFGVDYGLANGFLPYVNLLISVEAGIPAAEE